MRTALLAQGTVVAPCLTVGARLLGYIAVRSTQLVGFEDGEQAILDRLEDPVRTTLLLFCCLLPCHGRFEDCSCLEFRHGSRSYF